MHCANEYIILKDVNKRYKNGEEKISALKNINLTIKKGEFVAIVGPSGSGKTTLMNTIGCLDDISSGMMMFYGIDTSELNESEMAQIRNRYVGFIFQKYNLLPYLTAKENVVLPAQYTQKNYKCRNERAVKILEKIGLADRVGFRPNQLSGGQQQRVSIARALMNDADIILADEPTGALDSVTGSHVMEILRELNQKGKTIILVTHDREIALQVDRVITMNDGEITSDQKGIPDGELEEQNFRGIQSAPLSAIFGIVEAFKTSFRALNGHRIRSFLSMLGVIIGVFAVLMSVAISEGTRDRIMMKMKQLDNNTIEIRPGNGWVSLPEPGSKSLDKGDLDTLNEILPDSIISPVMTSGSTVNLLTGSIDIMLRGVSNEYLSNNELISGRVFDNNNQADSDATAVIDVRLAETIFGTSSNAVGKFINISDHPFEVVGVINNSITVSDKTMMNVWVPWTSYINRVMGSVSYDAIQVRTGDPSEVGVKRKKIDQALELSRGKKDFFIVTNDSMAEMIANVSGSMKLLTVGISAISLLVGGVGVMNIMFVSVTERIHEIGIRLSVGASPADIKRQFLIESVFICCLGGAIGVALTGISGAILPYMTNKIEMALTLTPVIIACAFSCLIGIVFGYMPAKKASSYTPAKALGYT